MIEKKMPLGRLNTDDSHEVFPEQDYQAAQNISIIDMGNGKQGAVKHVEGNRLVEFAGVDGLSDPKVRGAYEDRDDGRLFYFVYNGDAEDAIVMYDKSSDSCAYVMKGLSLGLGGRKITGIAKIGNLLYWAEEGKPPKRVNVERGLRS